MTRRSQVVRSSRSNGPSTSRPFPGGATIFCTFDPCYRAAESRMLLGSLRAVAQDPYQRFFASATVSDVRSWWPVTGDPDIVNVDIRYGGGAFAAVKQTSGFPLPSGMYGPSSVALTGVIDLPAGEHSLELWFGAETWGNWCSVNGFTFQVIEGQLLDAPGCVPPPPPN